MLDDIDIESLHIDIIGLTLDREAIIHCVTILTLILLYISFALKLTCPLYIERPFMIIILWGWVGNITHSNFLIQSPCDAEQHAPIINGTVIVASDVVSASNHYPFLTPCGLNMFNIYFSALCIFSSLMSFMSETRHYCLSFLFKTLSILTTVIIFLVPIACNRFRFASTAILILRITLYNLAWNMIRFLRDTRGDIITDYSKGDLIMRGYESIYRNLVMPSRHRKHQMEAKQLSNSKRRPNRSSRYYEDDDEDEDSNNGDEIDEDEEDEYDDIEDDDEEEYELYHRKRKNPSSVLESLEKTNTIIKKIDINLPVSKQELRSRHEQQVPQQISHFSQLCKINRRNRPSCFWSWKHRAYDDRISDIVRIVWVLVICPLYLFTVVLFLIGLGYYIRKNVIELDATRKVISAMEKIIK